MSETLCYNSKCNSTQLYTELLTSQKFKMASILHSEVKAKTCSLPAALRKQQPLHGNDKVTSFLTSSYLHGNSNNNSNLVTRGNPDRRSASLNRSGASSGASNPDDWSSSRYFLNVTSVTPTREMLQEVGAAARSRRQGIGGARNREENGKEATKQGRLSRTRKMIRNALAKCLKCQDKSEYHSIRSGSLDHMRGDHVAIKCMKELNCCLAKDGQETDDVLGEGERDNILCTLNCHVENQECVDTEPIYEEIDDVLAGKGVEEADIIPHEASILPGKRTTTENIYENDLVLLRGSAGKMSNDRKHRRSQSCDMLLMSNKRDTCYGSQQIRDVYQSRSTTQKMYRSYRGKVNLSIDFFNGKLVVEVYSATQLASNATGQCHSEVQVTIPGRCTLHGRTVRASSNPSYNDRFTCMLQDEDLAKRVLVSVWEVDAEGSASNQRYLLGCTSFGIQNIANNNNMVSGWYFLLDAPTGMKKYMRVCDNLTQTRSPSISMKSRSRYSIYRSTRGSCGNSQQPVTMRTKSKECQGNNTSDLYRLSATSQDALLFSSSLPRVHHRASWSSSTRSSVASSSDPLSNDGTNTDSSSDDDGISYQMLHIPLVKGSGDYGLTLSGGYPAKVSYIEPGSPSEKSGLCVGDQILSINEQWVETMYADTVGVIIRHLPHCIVLGVKRNRVANKQSCDSITMTTNFHLLQRIIQDFTDNEDDQIEMSCKQTYV